jgi:N-methylhydantoinase B
VVDAEATQTLRSQMRAGRNAPLPIFNRGPDVDTLRANCLAETGLPAPIAPVWRTRPTPAPALALAAE